MRYRKYKRLAIMAWFRLTLGNLNETLTRVMILNTNIVLTYVGERCQSYSVTRWLSALLTETPEVLCFQVAISLTPHRRSVIGDTFRGGLLPNPLLPVLPQ